MKLTVRNFTSRKTQLRAAAVAVGACGVLTLGAPTASAIQPNTVFFSTEKACIAAKPHYSGSFTSITQNCTYSGRYFLGWKLDAGPYFLVYQARSQ